MDAMIIVNPHAHSGIAPEQLETSRRDISLQLKDALQLDNIEWRETQHPGHAKELAEEAVRKRYGYVFAAGGDGTVNEVLNGIMGVKLEPIQRPTFGVLPFGTSNDFFAALKSAEASRKVEDDNLTLSLDVGHVLFDGVERYFCLTTGIGLFSWANEQYLQASRIFGRRFAHIPAAIMTIISYQFLPNVQISRDGKQMRSRRILCAIVNNSPVIAGGTPVTPDAKIDDGQLDVCIIKPVSWLHLLWLMFEITTKTHTHSRSIELGRIRELIVTARQPLPIHVDGELVPEIDSKARRMKVDVIPSALRVVVPSICEIKPAELVESAT